MRYFLNSNLYKIKTKKKLDLILQLIELHFMILKNKLTFLVKSVALMAFILNLTTTNKKVVYINIS